MRSDANKTAAQWVQYFKDTSGLGARIVEGPCHNAVCNYIAALEAENAELKARLAELENREPYAWHVPPMARMFFGEFAELDAKAEARRAGGTAAAIPVYTAPKE